MKIEAVGRVIETKDGKYAPGTPFEADDKEAAWFIKLGYAKEAEAADPEPKKGTTEAKAAKVRAALEAKAVELKIYTPEAVKALSDDDLKAVLARTLGDRAKELWG